MRILAFTDVHGNAPALRRLQEKAAAADVVVTTGDFTLFEQDAKRVMSTLSAFPRPVLLIPGNHEYSGSIERLCGQLPNLNYLHRRAMHFPELSFLGWGGGGFAQMDPELELNAPRLAREVQGRPFVFLLHGPPHGTALDHLLRLGHRGCRSRRAFIERYQPRLVLCGHLHENFGKRDCIGTSLILNPGPQGAYIDIKPLQTVEARG